MKEIIDILDCKDNIKKFYVDGQPKGTTTGFSELDKHWTWKKTDLTLVIGRNSEGKSTMLMQLMLIKSIISGWTFAACLPENMPDFDVFIDLMRMYVGKGFDKDDPDRMTKTEALGAIEAIQDKIKLINPKGLLTIDEIFERAIECKEKYNIDALIIDPWNLIDHDYGKSFREDLYISKTMTRLKEFAVRQNICLILVAHVKTPELITDVKSENFGEYPKPTKYSTKGGGGFSDKADNVLAVYRPNMVNNPLDPTVILESQKIRKQSLVGITGPVRFLYNPKTSRYEQNGFNPLNK